MAVTQYAFFVDSDACSGCKTCQVACKDKNDLPAGVHWRRVFEVTAGGWQRKGAAWAPEVVAYHLSVACHHCVHAGLRASVHTRGHLETGRRRRLHRQPALHALPEVRVRLSLRRDPVRRRSPPGGQVRLLRRPARCGPAAGVRGRLPEPGARFRRLRRAQEARHGEIREVFPLPAASIADPSLAIRPHRQRGLARERGPEVANWEEL